MAKYDFVTCWQFKAPIEDVYRAISRPVGWPQWWKGLQQVEALGSGSEQGKGLGNEQAGSREYRYHWQSPLGYSLCFDIRVMRLYAPWLIVGEARGDLEGWGCWQLSETAGVTRVRYRWRVRTTQSWMNLVAPLARPLFVWSHDVMMRNGALGLSRLLQAPLLERGRLPGDSLR